jgi:hypothetical protein
MKHLSFILLTFSLLLSLPTPRTLDAAAPSLGPWQQVAGNEGIPSHDPVGWYREQVFSSFRRLIPYSPNKDQLHRLMHNLELGPAGRTEVDQVLKVHRLETIGDFLNELDGRLDRKRIALNDAERRQQAGEVTEAYVQAAIKNYSALRLKPQELAVLIHFYRQRDAQSNRLIMGRGLRRMDASRARRVQSVTRFPYTPLRTHGENQDLIPWSEELQKNWRDIYQTFEALGLELVFLEIWSQLINQNTGNKRFRHIETFEERFLLSLRELAITQNRPFEAQKLMVAYLSNHASAQMLDRYGENPYLWRPEIQKKMKGSLAEFLAYLNQTPDRHVLASIFRSGDLPRSWPQPQSIQAQRALSLFQLASRSTSVQDCLTMVRQTARDKYTPRKIEKPVE